MARHSAARWDLYVRVAALAAYGVVIGMARERFLAGYAVGWSDAALLLMPLAAFASQSLHYRSRVQAHRADWMGAGLATALLAAWWLGGSAQQGVVAVGVYVLMAWTWAARTRKEMLVAPERELRHYLQHASALSALVAVAAAALLGAMHTQAALTRAWLLLCWIGAVVPLLTSWRWPCPAAAVEESTGGIVVAMLAAPQASMLFAIEGAGNAASYFLTLGFLGVARADLPQVAAMIVIVQLGGAAVQMALKRVVEHDYRPVVIASAAGVGLLGTLLAFGWVSGLLALVLTACVGALHDQLEPARLRAALARLSDARDGSIRSDVVLGRELALMLGRMVAVGLLLLAAARSWTLALLLASAVIAAEAWLLLRVLAGPPRELSPAAG